MHRLLLLIFYIFLWFGCATIPQKEERKKEEVALEISLPRQNIQKQEPFPWLEPTYRPRELARLRIGMTRAEVLDLFKEPRSIKKTPLDEYWEYDWFELYFRGGRLVNWFDL
ncbi:MAG: hypothetical protein SNJ78_11005 [Spirochaetales bacterium]